MHRSAVLILLTTITGLSLTGCSSAPEPSASCENAAVQALAQEQELYDTHPLWTTAAPGPDATEEEFAEYDKLQADEEAQWTAIYSVIYAECESPADWWATAKEHPGIAGVTGPEFLEPESLRTWCTGSETQPACRGLEEWLASDPS